MEAEKQENQIELEKYDFKWLYIGLAICAFSLILTGIFIEQIFGIFSLRFSDSIIWILRILFWVSAIFDIGLIFYAKLKL